MERSIDFYFDFISPYGFFASLQIEELAQKHGYTVNWRPYLIGVAVTKVMGLKPNMQTPLKAEYIMQDIRRIAEAMSINLNTSNVLGQHSRHAARAFYYLADRDIQAAKTFAAKVFDTLWVQGGDITDMATIESLLETVECDTPKALDWLQSDNSKERLQIEVESAIKKGVFGSPFFLAEGQSFWGADRLPMLENWIKTTSA